jgi:hypothetical protein
MILSRGVWPSLVVGSNVLLWQIEAGTDAFGKFIQIVTLLVTIISCIQTLHVK